MCPWSESEVDPLPPLPTTLQNETIPPTLQHKNSISLFYFLMFVRMLSSVVLSKVVNKVLQFKKSFSVLYFQIVDNARDKGAWKSAKYIVSTVRLLFQRPDHPKFKNETAIGLHVYRKGAPMPPTPHVMGKT